MKKFLSILMAIMMVVQLLPVSALADTSTSGVTLVTAQEPASAFEVAQKAIDDASHPLLQVGAEVQEGPFATGEDFIYEITCVREPSPVYQATHEGMLPCFTEYKNAKVTLTPPDGVVFLITNPQGGYNEVDGPFTYTFNNTLEATGSSSSFQIRARMKDNGTAASGTDYGPLKKIEAYAEVEVTDIDLNETRTLTLSTEKKQIAVTMDNGVSNKASNEWNVTKTAASDDGFSKGVKVDGDKVYFAYWIEAGKKGASGITSTVSDYQVNGVVNFTRYIVTDTLTHPKGIANGAVVQNVTLEAYDKDGNVAKTVRSGEGTLIISSDYVNHVQLSNGVDTPYYTRYKVTAEYKLADFKLPYGATVVEADFTQSNTAQLSYQRIGEDKPVRESASASASYYKETKPGRIKVQEYLQLKENGVQDERAYEGAYASIFAGGATFEIYAAEDFDETTGQPKAGATAVDTVKVPTGEQTEGLNSYEALSKELAPGKYVVRQTKRPDGTDTDIHNAGGWCEVEVQEGAMTPDASATAKFVNPVQYKAIVQIKKVDVNDKAISGVTFTAIPKDGSASVEAVTQSDGVATFILGLEQETTYIIRETGWDAEKYMPAADFEVTVEPQQYLNLTGTPVVNQSNKGSLTIRKFGTFTDAADKAEITSFVDEAELKNFSFTIERSTDKDNFDAEGSYDKSFGTDGKLIATLSATGVASVGSLARTDSTGKTWYYRVTENTPPEGWTLLEGSPAVVQLKDEPSKTVDVLNKRALSIRVEKSVQLMAEDGSRYEMADKSGITFELLRYAEENSVGGKAQLESVGTSKLTADGKASFGDLAAKDAHGHAYKYVLREKDNASYTVSAGDGCKLVNINGEQLIGAFSFTNLKRPILTFAVKNEENVGAVVFTKTDASGKTKLPGAEVKVSVSTDGGKTYTVVGTAVTDKNGQISYTRVPLGTTYQFEEITAPDGYLLQANSTVTATVESALQTVNVSLKNDKKPTLKVTKRIIDPSSGTIANATSGTFVFGVYEDAAATKPVKNEDGTDLTVTVNAANNSAVGTVTLPDAGKYYLKEISVSGRNDLLASATVYGPYTATRNGTVSTGTVLGGTGTIVNYMNRGRIVVKKTDAKTGKVISARTSFMLIVEADSVDAETAALLKANGFKQDANIAGGHFYREQSTTNGGMTFSNVPQKFVGTEDFIKYTLKETGVPSGYIDEGFERTGITVAATLNNQQYTSTKTVTNNPQGRIVLQKYLINSWEKEQENQIRTAFAGAHFDVYLLKDGKIQEWVSSGVTDSKGQLKFEGLDATCDYLLVETDETPADPPEGERFAKTKQFAAGTPVSEIQQAGYVSRLCELSAKNNGNSVSTEFDNYEPYSQIKLRKVSSKDHTILLDHAEFELYGMTVAEWEDLNSPKADENGDLTTGNLDKKYKLDYTYETGTNYNGETGTFLTKFHAYEGWVYFLRETEAPDGYSIVKEWYGPYSSEDGTLKKDAITEVLAENKPNEGPDDSIRYVNITVEKLLELNDKNTKPLAGVTFGVYLADKDGQYVQVNGAQVKVASLTTGLNDEHADRAFGISTSIKMHELYAQYPDYVERLENGEYRAHFVLVEEKWPANVTPRALEYPLTVTTQGQTTTMDTTYTGANAVRNYENNKSSVRIRKYGYTYGTNHEDLKPLAGVTIGIWTNANDAAKRVKPYKTAVTGEDGFAYFELEPNKDYWYREYKSIDGYELSDDAAVKFHTPDVGKAQTETYTIYNPTWRLLNIHKVNAGNGKPEAGLKFYVKQGNTYLKDAQGQKLVLTTGENGLTETIEVPAGTYTIEEVGLEGTALKNFQLYNEGKLSHTYTKKNERAYTFEVANAATGELNVLKTDLAGNAIEDIQFELLFKAFANSAEMKNAAAKAPATGYSSIRQGGAQKTILTTDKDGKLHVSGLTPGWYQLVEQPSKNYVTAAPRYVKVLYNGASVEVTTAAGYTELNGTADLTIANTPKGLLTINKKFHERVKNTEGQTVTFEIYKNKADKSPVETVRLTIGQNEITSATVRLAPGTYYIKEASTGWLAQYEKHLKTETDGALAWVDGWVEIEIPTPNTVTEAESVPLFVNFVNYPTTAQFTLNKVDDNEQIVNGARFALYYKENDKKVYYQTNKTWSTSEAGQMIWDTPVEGTITVELPKAHVKSTSDKNYYLEEVFTPIGYTKPETDAQVVLNPGEDAGEVKIVNITGLYISLTKFGRQKNDVQNPERVTVAGAEFTLYEVVNGKATVVQTQTTDANGKLTFPNLPKLAEGYYAIAETKEAAGYVANSLKLYRSANDATPMEPVSGIQTAEGRPLYQITSTETVTSLAGYNTPTGSLLILKYNMQYGSDSTKVPDGIGFDVQGPESKSYYAVVTSYKKNQTEVPGFTPQAESGYICIEGIYYSYAYLTGLTPGDYTVSEHESGTTNFFFTPHANEKDPWYPVRSGKLGADGDMLILTFGNVPIPEGLQLNIKKSVTSPENGKLTESLQNGWQTIGFKLADLTKSNDGDTIQMPLNNFEVDDSNVTFSGAKGNATTADYRLKSVHVSAPSYGNSIYWNAQDTHGAIAVSIYGVRADNGQEELLKEVRNAANGLSVALEGDGYGLAYRGFVVKYGVYGGVQMKLDPGFKAGDITLEMQVYQPSNREYPEAVNIKNTAKVTMNYNVTYLGGKEDPRQASATADAALQVKDETELPLMKLTKAAEVLDAKGNKLDEETMLGMVQPGQKVRYTLRVTNESTSDTALSFKQPVIVDQLPDLLEAEVSDVTVACSNASRAGEVSVSMDDQQITVLLSGEMEKGDSVTVTIVAGVRVSGVLYGAGTGITNTAYLASRVNLPANAENPDGDSFRDVGGAYPSQNVTVNGKTYKAIQAQHQLSMIQQNELNVHKLVSADLSGMDNYFGSTGYAVANLSSADDASKGLINYKLLLVNGKQNDTQGMPVSGIAFADSLPVAGDNRNSKWAVEGVTGLTVTVNGRQLAAGEYTVQYSAKSYTTRALSDMLRNGVTGDWSASAANARSFIVKVNDETLELPAGATAIISYYTKAPGSVEQDVFFEQAVNDCTAGYNVQSISGLRRMSISSQATKVVLMPGTVSLGDRVWIDKNANGIQDEGEVNYAGDLNIRLKTYINDGSPRGTNATVQAGDYHISGLMPGVLRQGAMNAYDAAGNIQQTAMQGATRYTYQLEIEKDQIPAGYIVTTAYNGAAKAPTIDDTNAATRGMDSNFMLKGSSYRSERFYLKADDMSFDLGLVRVRNVSLTKTDDFGNLLEGAEFTIYGPFTDEELAAGVDLTGKAVGTMTTDAKGKASFVSTDMSHYLNYYRNYVVVETGAAARYFDASKLTITANGNVSAASDSDGIQGAGIINGRNYFILTAKDDQAASNTDAARVENTYRARGELALKGLKTFVGGGDKGGFRFTLKQGDEVVATTTSAEDGSFLMGVQYTEADIGKTYTYTLTEDNTGVDGVIYDTRSYIIHVSVADSAEHNGTLVISMTTEGENAPVETDNNQKVFEFVNHAVGSLTLRKEVTGNGGEVTRSFKFTITLKDKEGLPLTGSIYSDTLTFDANGQAVVHLKHGESLMLKKLPVGTKYTITEKDYNDEGYITTANGNVIHEVTGTIDGVNAQDSVSFVNSRELGNLKITKKVIGNALNDALDANDAFEFTVKLYEQNGLTLANDYAIEGRVTRFALTESGTDAKGAYRAGTLTLKKGESVTLKDIPAGTLYEVLENTDTATMHKGYETENPVRSGSITAATANAPVVALEFVNKREMGKLRITKTVEGTNPEDNKAFTMTVLLTPAKDSVVLGTTAEEYGTTANITVTKTGEKREITFALKDGESIELSRIPVGTTYMVVEDSTYTGRTYPGGPYTVTYTPATINTTAQEITSETAQVTVLNVRNAYGGLTITKLLNDAIVDGLQGEGVSYGANLEFQFKLKLHNAQYKLDEGYGYTKRTSAGEQTGTLTLTDASEDGRKGTLTFTLKGGESITFNYANPGEARATGAGILSGTECVITEVGVTRNGQLVEVKRLGYETTIQVGNEKESGTEIRLAALQAGQTQAVTFTNERVTSSLVVTKQTSGTESGEGSGKDKVKEFTFNLKLLSGPDANEVDEAEWKRVYTADKYSGTTKLGTVTLDLTGAAGAAFTLKDGETLVVNGLLKGVLYTLEETSYRKDGYMTTVNTVKGYQVTETVGSDGRRYTFVNERKAGDLTISKNVVVNGEDMGNYAKKNFRFTIRLERTETDGVELAGTYRADYRADGATRISEITFTDVPNKSVVEATIELKHGEALTIRDIPVGTRYTVTEDNYRSYEEGGFTTTVNDKLTSTATGEILEWAAGKPQATAIFTNTRKVGNLSITKQVDGELGKLIAQTQEFTFEITMASVTPMGEGSEQKVLANAEFNCDLDGAEYPLKLNAQGKATFTLKAGQKLTIKGIQTGTLYQVKEITTDIEKLGYHASVSVSDVRIKTMSAGAAGEVKTNTTDGVTVTNALEGGSFSITKALYGNNTEADKAFEMTLTLTADAPIVLVGREFPITITGVDGTAVQTGTVKVQEGGVISFALKGGQTATIDNLPWSTTAALAEDAKYAQEDYTDENNPQTKGPYTITYTTQQLDIPDSNGQPEDAKQSAVVTNIRNSYGALTIGKTLVGNYVETERAFTFTLTLTNEKFQNDVNTTYECELMTLTKDDSGKPVMKNEAKQLTVVDGEATFTLKGGQSLIIPGILRGTKYTVKEAADDVAADGYIITSEGAEGVIKADGGAYTVGYTNTRWISDVQITKTLAGTGATNAAHVDKEFAFTMKLSRDDNVKSELWKNHIYQAEKTLTNGTTETTTVTFADGVASFKLKGDETLKIKGLLMGTAYVITEANYRAEGYFTKMDGADSLSTEKRLIKNDGPTTYTHEAVNTRESADLSIEKKLDGNGTEKFKNKDFAFTLRLGREEDGVKLDGEYAATRYTANGAQSETLTVTDGKAVFTLKGGEKLTIHDIPVDTYVMAMEAEYLDSDGFDTYWRNNPSEKNGFAALLNDGEKITLTCVNERNVGDLVLEKKLTGNDPEWEREFTFNVTLKPAEVIVLEEEIEVQSIEDSGFTGGGTSGRIVQLPVDYTYDAIHTDAAGNETETTVTFVNGKATITLKGGERLQIKGILEGTGYTVEEVTDQLIRDGYIITGAVQEGFISSTEDATVTVENNRDTGSIAVTKALAGNDTDADEAFEMTLTLTPKENVVLEGKEFDLTITSNTEAARTSKVKVENNTISFAIKGGETATITHLPTGTGFVLDENGKYQDAAYPNGAYGVDFVFSDSTDRHYVTTGQVSATVTNTRNAYGALIVSKTLSGNATEPERLFSFELTLRNDGFQNDLDRNYQCELVEGAASTPYELKVVNGKASFQLKGSQSLVIPGILRDTLCTVTEDDSILAENYEILGGNKRYVTIIEEDGVYTAAYTNYRASGTLEVSKTLRGNATDAEKEFRFTLTLSRKDDMLESLWKNHTYEAELTAPGLYTVTTLEVKDGKAEFTLKGGQTLSILGLPKGTEYIVTEDDSCFAEGYITEPDTYTFSNTITDVPDGYLADFVNNRNEGSLTIRKTLSGNGGDANRKFLFTLRLTRKDGVNVSGTYAAKLNGEAATVTVDENGYVTFTLADQEELTVEGILTGTEYTVVEEDCAADGYTTTATNAAGAITTANTLAAFDNHREVGSLTVRKVLEGDAADEETIWHFVITATLPDGRPVNGTFPLEGRRNAEIAFTEGTANLSLRGNTAVTITGLLAGTTYRVREIEADIDNYVTTATGANGTIRYAETATARIVNTRNILQEYKNISVEKTWRDRNNREKLRPETLNVYLFADNVAIAKATLSEENGWKFTFENLPVYHEDATEISYRVVETATAGYYARTQYDGNTVRLTNTHPTEIFITIEDTPVPLGAGINMNEGDCFN